MYREVVGESEKELLHYVPNYEIATEFGRTAITDAERFVWQVTELEQELSPPADGRRCHFVPVVNCPFLFPLSGEAHPSNQPLEFWSDGPYPAETGDSLLNAMIRKGLSPDEAVRKYIETDVASVRSVQRIMEISLDRQHERDERCGGYESAKIIIENLREEPLFRTRGHLERRLNRHLADTLFSSMDLGSSALRSLSAIDTQRFVPPTEMPIHPSIAKAFGLAYVTADTTYAFNFEGNFTLREWALRYMQFTWSSDLMEGLWHFHAGRMEQSIPFLQRATIECPRSVLAKESLRFAEARALEAEKT